MKILIVSKCPTHPVNAGNRKGILNQVEILRKLGNEVFFLYIHENAIRSNSLTELLAMKEYWGNHLFVYNINSITHLYQLLLHRYRVKLCNGYCKVDDYYPRGLSKFVSNMQAKYQFNACIVNYYYLSKVFTKVHFEHEALFAHDYFAYKGLLIGNKSVGFNTTAHEEAIASQRSKSIFSVNTEESYYFQKISPKSKIYNIFSHYDYHPSKYCGNKNILFLSGDNEYNINGLKWFLADIWPILTKNISGLRLIIAGGICKKIKNFASDNVLLAGYIEDTEEFFNQGDIVINPTYQGTGLKIKTFEGMASDKVIMAHPHSLEGVYEPQIAPVFVSTKPNDWLKFLQNHLCNPIAIELIKERNRKYINDMNQYIENEYKRFLNMR